MLCGGFSANALAISGLMRFSEAEPLPISHGQFARLRGEVLFRQVGEQVPGCEDRIVFLARALEVRLPARQHGRVQIVAVSEEHEIIGARLIPHGVRRQQIIRHARPRHSTTCTCFVFTKSANAFSRFSNSLRNDS